MKQKSSWWWGASAAVDRAIFFLLVAKSWSNNLEQMTDSWRNKLMIGWHSFVLEVFVFGTFTLWECFCFFLSPLNDPWMCPGKAFVLGFNQPPNLSPFNLWVHRWLSLSVSGAFSYKNSFFFAVSFVYTCGQDICHHLLVYVVKKRLNTNYDNYIQ